MENPQTMGMNRTGIAMSPADTATMLQETVTVPPPQGDLSTLERFRMEYIKSASAIGTIPPPGTLKGIATTMIQKLKGDQPEVFIDLLGERLAFERTGVRLYDLLINKCESQGEVETGALETLREIRDEELEHFEMLVGVMTKIGADPTAMTPAADVSAVMSQGLVQVLADPRTSPAQCMEAILVAELTDNDGWATLTQLAQTHGMDEVMAQFQEAEAAERRHLKDIRSLLAKMVLGKEKSTMAH